MKLKHLLLLLAVSLLCGCAAIKKATDKGFNVAASVGKSTLSLLDVTTPLVQDPTQPGDTNAVIVNPAIVTAAQGAATTFGGPYGIPISLALGAVAGITGMFVTQSRRRKAAGATQ